MTGTINDNIISVRQGDSFALNLAIGCDCQPLDLTGATLLMQVRDKDTNALIFGVSGTDVDVAHGKMVLLLTPEMTAIAVGDYVCDVQLTLPDGEVHTVYPANVGQVATFRVTRQVTVPE